MSGLATLYLALAIRAAGLQLSRPLIEDLLARLGYPCEDEFLDALFRLLQAPAPHSTPAAAAGDMTLPPLPGTADPASPEWQESSLEGRYLYGVVRTGESQGDFHAVGVDGNRVFLVRERDLAALVHACPPEPYQSDDPKRVTEWLQAHQSVLEAAMAKWGTVIPTGFDTILKGRAPDPDEVVRSWIRDAYDRLDRTWQRIEGKAEYDVEITWDAGAAEREARAASETIRLIEAELASLSSGLAYLQRQRLDKAMAEAVGSACSAHARRFLDEISSRCTETKPEAVARTGQGEHLVLRVACLATTSQVEKLGEALDTIAAIPGFSVRFTGPWPPFSFVE